MVNKAITKKQTDIEKILTRRKWEAARKIETWREKNEKYFKNWDSTKAIRILREKNGRP